jgi:DNA-binding NarL/FixJ family response regulator
MILVVDDNRDEVALLVETLEQAGFTALAATSGEMALTLLERVVPHLVVMDAVMPGLDGFETCRRIRRTGHTAHLPVIFMTGLTDTAHVLEGLAAGGVDYVTKPVGLAELLARIRIHSANARAAHGARLALDASGRHLFAVDGAGELRWATPQAGQVLAAAFGAGLPPEVRQELQQTAHAGHEGAVMLGQPGQARFLLRSGPDEFLFHLRPAPPDEAAALRQLDLTAREIDVLRWLTHGKTNREISEILGISPRTVNKHLERIFAKMGVENRASATSLALRLMAGKL